MAEGGVVLPPSSHRETWKFNGSAGSGPAKTLPDPEVFKIQGYAYLNDEYCESFDYVYYNEDWAALAFGAAGYWDAAKGTYLGANILVFDAEPTGQLLAFLQANATKQEEPATGHKLTFDAPISVTVNGNSVTSPYQLVNGDKITATSKFKMYVNGSYVNGSLTLSIQDQDISITKGTLTTTTTTVVVNYSETIQLNLTENGKYKLPTKGRMCKKDVYATVNVPQGSIQGGYTVTFMSDGSKYAVSSVTPGQSVPRPNTPVSASKHFTGWYTAATDGDEIQFPYTPTESVSLYAHFADTVIVGVTGLTNENGMLTLTDSAAGVETYTTSKNGNYVSVTNPLSAYFPFSQIEEFTDSDGNAFVKFPKLWMKWETDDNGYITGYKFSNGQADSDYFVPDAFLDPTYLSEDTYLPYFALGKYEMSGSSSKGYSKSGQSCLVEVTRSAARSAARAYGNAANLYNGYQQLDFAQYVVYNLLCMMFYRTSNIQKVYGGRTGSGTVTSWSNASVTGTCDGVSGMNGWNVSTDCVKMLGVENPYGNISKWVDGVYFSSQTIYAHRYPQQYAESTSNGTALGFSRPGSSGVYIKYFKKGTGVKAQSYMYAAETGGSTSQYCGDYYWYSSSGTVLNVGGYWGDGSYAGLWCLGGGSSGSRSDSGIGARLSYRPL